MQKEKVIGIDLGTTFSLASFVYENGVQLISKDGVGAFIRSIVCLDESVVGSQAEKLRNVYPSSTIYSFKQFMGQEFDKLPAGNDDFPYLVSKGSRNNVLLGPLGNQVSPEFLSAKVLEKIKSLAEEILQAKVTKAVITVPAYFGDSQRQATKAAALIAGIEPIRIINEPTASAIAYGLDQKKIGNIVVYDLGGGTFDTTVLKLKQKVFRVIATAGDNYLGGDDFDNALIHLVLEKLGYNKKLATPQDIQLLKVIAEETKILLSSEQEATFNLPILSFTDSAAEVKVTKLEFETNIRSLANRTLKILDKVLSIAKLSKEQIDEIVLVGGSTKIPFIRSILSDYFQKSLNTRLDPDKVVSYGAAIQAHVLQGGRRDYLLMDVIPLSLGIETMGGVFEKLIIHNSSVPTKVKETFSTAVDNQNSVDINIYQGEREFVKDCRLVGKFQLSGIPAMPAGMARIEVEFVIDQNGILTVVASEMRSGINADISLVPEHGLTKDELEAMIEQSVLEAKVDMDNRKLVELKQKAQTIIYSIEKQSSKIKEVLAKTDYDNLMSELNVLKSSLNSDVPEKIEEKLKIVQSLSTDVADSLISDAITKELKH